MTYLGFAQRLCLLSLAAAIATLCLLATTSEADAQGRCRPGYQRTQKGCVRVACGANMVLRNGQCVCASGYVWQGKACVRQVVRRCGPNEVRQDRRCVCVQGYVRRGATCVAALPCRPNEVRQGRRCVCVQGYVRQGGACIAALPRCGANEARQGRQCACAEGYARKSDGSCRREIVCRGRYEVERDGRCACADGYARRDGQCVRLVVAPPLVPPIPGGPGRQPPPGSPPASGGAPPVPPLRANATDFVPGQLLVGFRSQSELQSVVLRELERADRSGGVSAGGARSRTINVDRVGARAVRIRLDFRDASGDRLSGTRELAALQDYARRLTEGSSAAFAHPNWIMELERTLRLEQLSPTARVQSRASRPAGANDPALRTGLMWHYLAPPSGMNAAAAWALNKGSRDVVVAVVDSGILPDHPDIRGSGNVLAGYNFISDPEEKGGGREGPDADATEHHDSCSEYVGSAWHGTHVAGTIGAAQSDNDLGIAGVNWAVSVLPVRAMGRCGRGTIADLAGAVTWAAGLPVPGVPPNKHKAHVINLSLSISKACLLQNVGLLKQALDDAREAGTIVVAAAGNKRIDIKDVTPAGCAGVISVAASDARGHLTPYSNYGGVTLMAPGGNLDRDDDNDNRPDGVWSLVAPSDEFPSGVAAMEGTSMAAPHVSAAIALVLSVKPELRGKPDEIEKLLRRSLARRPAGACSKPCGGGLLDAKAMLEAEATSSR